MVQYSFGGNTGHTAESLKRRRAEIRAMLDGAVGRNPQTVGEGIAVLGQALAGRFHEARLDRDEKQLADQAMSDFNSNSTAKNLIREWLTGGAEAPSGSSPRGHSPAGREYFAGGDGDYFANIRAAESGGNLYAKNPNSSATGPFQFTTGTWDELGRKYPDLGLTPDGRTDPAQNERAIRAFTADNARVLADAGIEATGGNLYAAHFLGAGGARNVLSQPDNASVASIVGDDVVRANPFLRGMSVGQFKQWATRKGGSGGVNVLEGGEGDDQFDAAIVEQGLPLDSPGVQALRLLKTGSEPDPMQTGGVSVGGAPRRMAGSGINTVTGGPASSPAGPMPAGREYFAGTPLPMAAASERYFTPELPQRGPVPSPRFVEQAEPGVDPLFTAVVKRQRELQAARGPISGRDSAGYSYGVGAAYTGGAPIAQQTGQQTSGRQPPNSLLAALFGLRPSGTTSGLDSQQTASVQPGDDGQGDDIARLFAVLDNPMLPPAYREATLAALQQRREQARPEYQMGLEAKRLELEKTRRELARAGQGDGSEFKVVGNDLVRIAPDGTTSIVTPEGGQVGSGEFRFSGNSVEAQALNGLMDSGQLTPGQAQQLAAGKTVTGPNGEIMFMTPQGVFGQPAGGGQPQPIGAAPTAAGGAPTASAPAPRGTVPAGGGPRSGILPLTTPKTTLDERQAMTFADRMTASGDIINEYGDAGLNAKDQFIRGNNWIPDFAENWMVSDDFQRFDQARRDFINAQLRRESGAVISDEEFDNARKQYFPEPGDKPEVLAQKAANRATVTDGMARSAGPTYQARKTPPKGAIDMLRSDPGMAELFDEKYGAGAAARYLGGQ